MHPARWRTGLKDFCSEAEHSAMHLDRRRSTARGSHRRFVVVLAAVVVAVVSSCTAAGSGSDAVVQAKRPLSSVPVPTTTTVVGQVPTAPAVPVVRDTHILASSIPPGGTTTEIFRFLADGSDPVQLTSDQSVEHLWPRPSPDGSKILFYTAAPGSSVNDVDTNDLWVMDADGSHQRMLIPDGAYGWTRQGHVEWSPDGRQLLMSAGAATMDLFVTDAEGRSPVRVTDRGFHMAIDPSWAPDGRSAVFIGCPRESSTCWWWEYEVYRLDLATGAEQRLSTDGFADFDPYVSPDGTQIVWLRCTGLFPFGPWSIFRAPASTVPLQATAVVDDGNINSSVDFSADGSTLLFARHEIGVTTWQSAAIVGLDGSRLGFVGGRPAAIGQGTPTYWP